MSDFVAYYSYKGVISGALDAWETYSPKCTEGKFSEVQAVASRHGLKHSPASIAARGAPIRQIHVSETVLSVSGWGEEAGLLDTVNFREFLFHALG
jgi:hypothetical protein